MRAIYEDILLWLSMGSSSWFIPAPAISCGAQTTLGTLKQVVWLGAGQGSPRGIKEAGDLLITRLLASN